MNRVRLTERLGIKLLAWFLLALSVFGLTVSAAGIAASWELEVYSAADLEELKMKQFNDQIAAAGYNVAYTIIAYGQTECADRIAAKTNVEYQVLDPDGMELWKSAEYDALAESPYRFTHVFRRVTEADGTIRYIYINTQYRGQGSEEPAVTPPPPPKVTTLPIIPNEVVPTPKPTPSLLTTAPTGADITPMTGPAGILASAQESGTAEETETDTEPASAEGPEIAEYLLAAAIDPAFPIRDEYYWIGRGLELLWGLRYAVYGLAGLSLLLGVGCFLFLLCSAGHRAGREGLTPGYLTPIPFDLLTAVTAAFCAAAVWLAREPMREMGRRFSVLLTCAGIPVLALILTGWCATLALRVKLGRWWENTVFYRLLRLLRLALRAVFRGLSALVRGVPLIWRTVLLILAISFLELLAYFGLELRRDTEWFLLAWFLEKLLLGGAALYLALTLRRLQKGGMALAAGDLRYQTDVRAMFGDFRRHGENLNSIAAGMEAAVERQMKSERMKTELITNVSHDIKTPLTSIINYVDLLKTTSDPAQSGEYVEVLDRQARRLKKLTEDLIEVSKASTGNVEVAISPHSVNELLRQAAGEYGERLEKAGLETVLTLPEEELFAGMDGKLMWRVLDNLLNNVCKYAQSGTRFYLDAARQNGSVVIRFKNVSRERLNVSAAELMERFVRGDRARSGEGSGLGLSIARSLTELQQGSFSLTVDGDLFRVDLAFPEVSQE